MATITLQSNPVANIHPHDAGKENSSLIITDLSELESQINTIAEKIAPSVVSIVVAREVPAFRSDPF